MLQQQSVFIWSSVSSLGLGIASPSLPGVVICRRARLITKRTLQNVEGHARTTICGDDYNLFFVSATSSLERRAACYVALLSFEVVN